MVKSYKVLFKDPDSGQEKSLGVYEAYSKDGAQRQALKKDFPNSVPDWGYIQGCLIAKELRG